MMKISTKSNKLLLVTDPDVCCFLTSCGRVKYYSSKGGRQGEVATLQQPRCDMYLWMFAHHLKLSLSKTGLFFIPGKDCPHMDLSVTVEDVTVSPSLTARNLRVTLDDGLSCTANISVVARSCRFALYNIHRIRSFLTKDATGPSAGHLLPGPLQHPLGWTLSLCD